MTRVLVDTNVIVSFLTDRDPRQQAQAAALIEAAGTGGLELILHQTVLTELVYVLTNVYRVEPGEVSAMLRDLLSLPGVNVIDAMRWSRVLAQWPRRFTSFGDAVLASVAAAEKVDAVATFDADFRRRLRREGLATHW